METLYKNSGKIKILGISSSTRKKYACAAEDPISLELLKIFLQNAEKFGAEVRLIDLETLRIGPCKGCYSTCPAQCRFNEKNFKCDCYMSHEATLYTLDWKTYSLEEGYDKLSKEDLLKNIREKHAFTLGDEMYKVYESMMWADGIVFAGHSSFYSRPALLQTMLSRLCALDGGVEENWGDGKNLANSLKYAKKKDAKYKQRLYGKFAGFINVSKEGDSMTPDLLKACSMMGMRIVPFSVAYGVSWYDDKTHRTDKKKVVNDEYTLMMTKRLAKIMVEEIKNSDRKYGVYSNFV